MPIELLIGACKEAGEAALSLRGTSARQKADGAPVTAADMRAQEILLAALSPSALPIVSEESSPIPGHASGKAWIVDPLDGTKSFIAGDPRWAVMAALIENGSPVMGAVYAPELQTLWYAEKGNGAFVQRDGSRTRMHVSSTETARGASMLLSLHHPSDESRAVANRLGATVTRMSGLGVKACVVAEGAADMYWTEAKLGEWDVCAPQLIVQEAGGAFGDARGREIVYGSQDARPVAGAALSNARLYSALAEAGKRVLDE